MADCVVQRNDSNRRLYQRSHDTPQDRPRIGTVQLGGFFQGIGHTRKGGAHNNEVVGIDQCGQDQRPAGAIKANALDNQVQRDHAATEIHRKDKKLHNGGAGRHMLAGQAVGRNHREQNIENRTHDNNKQCVCVAGPEEGILEHCLIRCKRKPFRPEQNSLMPHEERWVAEGRRHNMDQRNQHAAQQHADNQHIHDIEQAAAEGFLDLGAARCGFGICISHDRFLLTTDRCH